MSTSDVTTRQLRPAAIAALIVAVVLPWIMGSCIKNDIPYPRIRAGFASIEIDGALQTASIDSINQTVTFYLAEETDIQNVTVSHFTLSPPGAEWADSLRFTTGIDLRKKASTVVSLYQDYTWSISAVQTIERYFSVENQIGIATVDPTGLRVIAYVPEGSNLKALKVKSIKLGSPAATYSPDINSQEVNFTNGVAVAVTDHGRTEQWTIYVQTSETTVSITSVDAWTNVAWVHAEAQEDKQNGVQYRKSGNTDWIDVDNSWITHSGGAFTARLIHLDPLTSYQVRAYSDDEFTAETEFTTGDTYNIPNGDMENWWLDGKVWCPWAEDGTDYWGTGNKGATTLGSSNTYPTDDTPSGSGQAACLETRFVGIGALGKLAAGNLFTGYYVRTEGTNGVLSFGREFSLRPTRLKGNLKYQCAEIDYVNTEMADLKGRPDTCIVWCALIDSAEPFEIRTASSNRNLFDPDGDYVVAYGKLQYGHSIDSFTPFDIELDYKSTSRVPTYIIVVASASKYGDYFTGGSGSTLIVDDFTLGFDY